MLTDRDLSRLLTLQYVHGGSLRYVGELFDKLENAGMVQVKRKEHERFFDVPVLSTNATITDKGKRVAEAGMMAMREVLK